MTTATKHEPLPMNEPLDEEGCDEFVEQKEEATAAGDDAKHECFLEEEAVHSLPSAEELRIDAGFDKSVGDAACAEEGHVAMPSNSSGGTYSSIAEADDAEQGEEFVDEESVEKKRKRKRRQRRVARRNDNTSISFEELMVSIIFTDESKKKRSSRRRRRPAVAIDTAAASAQPQMLGMDRCHLILLMVGIVSSALAILAVAGFCIATLNYDEDGDGSLLVDIDNASVTAAAVSVNTSSESAGDSSTSSELARFDQLVELVVQQGWSPESVFANRQGSQWDACIWLADFDKRAVSFDDDGEDHLAEVKERYAAAVLFFALKGRNWDRASLGWISQAHVCEWGTTTANAHLQPIRIGIDCQEENEDAADSADDAGKKKKNSTTIRRIVLPSMRAYGSLPAELALLQDLVELDLNHNEIKGDFPAAVQFLPALKTLSLQSNQLQGPLPDWLGQGASAQLETLQLADNQFHGPLPPSMANLQQLKVLTLSRNDLSSTSSLWNVLQPLASLEMLLASNIGLEGNNWDGYWPQMRVLDMSLNRLVGWLTPRVLEHPTLAVLDVHGNALEGTFPDTAPPPSSPLEFVSLGSNNLSGTFPNSLLRNTPHLKHLDLSNTNMTGPFPPFSAATFPSQLQHLDLSFNDFDAGPLPPVLAKNMTELRHLALQQTHRQGSIQDWSPKAWTHLEALDLGDNALTGELPTSLAEFAKALEHVILYRNRFTGDFAKLLQHSPELQTLAVQGNAWNTTTTPLASLCMPHLQQFILDQCTNTDNQDHDGLAYCPCCQCCNDGSGSGGSSVTANITDMNDKSNNSGDGGICSPTSVQYIASTAADPVWDTDYVWEHFAAARKNDLTSTTVTSALTTGGGGGGDTTAAGLHFEYNGGGSNRKVIRIREL